MKTLIDRLRQILLVQVPLGVVVLWVWTAFAPRPECSLDTATQSVCSWPEHFSDSGFFFQDVWIAVASLVAGIVSGIFLSRKLKAWGIFSQLLAAGTSIGIMWIAIKVGMSLNNVLVTKKDSFVGTGLLIARSNASLFIWALVTQIMVVIRP
ncbi:MAG: hypothetical protein RL410_744, partial [Actinomycetota bacterium]